MARPHHRFGMLARNERQESDLFSDDLFGARAPAWSPRGGWREDAEAAEPAARLISDPKLGFAWVLPKSSTLTPASKPAGAKPEDAGEDILGTDDRQVVRDTVPIAFRFVCCLDLIYEHPTDSTQSILLRGSGTLISNRHVLTAGHNLLNVLPGFAASGRRTVQRVFAAPGRNGRTLPFGESVSANTRVSPEWATAATNHQFDFGLITLADPIGANTFAALEGAALGFWSHRTLGGGTHIRPLDVGWLPGRPVNLDGYPSDKCLDQPPARALTAAEAAACTGFVPGNPRLRDLGSMQWRSFGHVIDASPATEPRSITYDNDSAVGHSGGPIWLRWEQYRNIIAVNTGGFPMATAPFTIVANMGVRITNDVLTRLRDWMRADGVTATF